MGERKAMEKSIPHLFTIYLENQTKKDGKRQSYEGSSRKAHDRSQTLGGERKKKERKTSDEKKIRIPITCMSSQHKRHFQALPKIAY